MAAYHGARSSNCAHIPWLKVYQVAWQCHPWSSSEHAHEHNQCFIVWRMLPPALNGSCRCLFMRGQSLHPDCLTKTSTPPCCRCPTNSSYTNLLPLGRLPGLEYPSPMMRKYVECCHASYILQHFGLFLHCYKGKNLSLCVRVYAWQIAILQSLWIKPWWCGHS